MIRKHAHVVLFHVKQDPVPSCREKETKKTQRSDGLRLFHVKHRAIICVEIIETLRKGNQQWERSLHLQIKKAASEKQPRV